MVAPLRIWKPYFHIYKEADSWSLGFSLTTRSISIAVGPFWATIFWRLF